VGTIGIVCIVAAAPFWRLTAVLSR